MEGGCRGRRRNWWWFLWWGLREGFRGLGKERRGKGVRRICIFVCKMESECVVDKAFSFHFLKL